MLKKNLLYTLSYIYLIVPILLFVIGWTKPFISIPIAALACYCLVKCVRNMPAMHLSIAQNKTKLIICVAILLVWVILSGIGGFVWQNTWDHMFRNAIFADLVNYDWPVVNFEKENPLLLCYYIGFWLPSALVAKWAGSMLVGYVFQLMWGFAGCVLAFMLISEWLKTVSYKALLIFIFFSGLDIIPFLYNGIEIKFFTPPYIELNALFFNASSNTNLLFWLYNQSIPFWVGFMLILLNNNRNYLLFTCSLLILFSPFPLIALLPAIAYLQLMGLELTVRDSKNRFLQILKTYITIENITGFVLLLLVGLFYSTNIASNKVRMNAFLVAPYASFFILVFSFLCLEFIIYMVFIYKKLKTEYFFLILFMTMIACCFVQLGNSNDLAWRTVIPASFYLMLLIMKEVNEMNVKKIKSILLMLVLAVGSINPIMEIARTVIVTQEYSQKNKEYRSLALKSVFLPNACYDNFIGQSDSFFYKYILKNQTPDAPQK